MMAHLGSHFLSRLPGELGMYLALSGARLKAADLLYSRIATHYVPSARLEDLKDRLVSLEGPPERMHESVNIAIEEFTDPITAAPLQEHRQLIDECFRGGSVDEIMAALAANKDQSEFAAKLLATMEKCSPTSMKITFKQLREGASKDIGECLKMEYRMSQGCTEDGADFFEGVRSILIDKDHAPKWNPASLDGVTEATVAGFFKDLGHRELSFPHA
jgi:enoyl-CoA hydratase/carnithine racemase